MNIKFEMEKSTRRGVRWLKIAFASLIAIIVCAIVWYVIDGGNMESPFRVVEIMLCFVGLVSMFGAMGAAERYDQLKKSINENDTGGNVEHTE